MTQNRDFIRVGRSRIEGTGVFAKRKIPRGTRIIEYTGEHIPVDQLYRVVEQGRPRVYTFALDETTSIDGSRNGNDARFFNHSCDPNCEPYVFDGHVYIYAIRDIVRGEELTFDYKLGPANRAEPVRYDPADYLCRCGAPNCRGSLIAPKRKLVQRRHLKGDML